ncbi:MAG: hypothetical protein AAFZ04_07580 [Pseudomonadota bacterium]
MRLPLGDLDDAREEAIARYLHLSKDVMPTMARNPDRAWPVVNDHCFQRIVLDAVSGGVWYDHIARPAYRNMTKEQAEKAVTLCEGIIAGTEDIVALNRQSLIFRGKLKTP